MQINSFFVGALEKMSSLDHAQQIAVSNLSLAMLAILAIFIPILMISRGGKIAENQIALKSFINPFYRQNSIEEILLGLNASQRSEMNSYEENAYEVEIYGWPIN